MPKIYDDEDLIDGHLSITCEISVIKESVISGYGYFDHKSRSNIPVFFTRYSDQRRLLADKLKPLFGLYNMDFGVILHRGKPYLMSVCSDIPDLILTDVCEEELEEEELSDVRAIIFFKVMIGSVMNNDKSIIVRTHKGKKIFISRDDRFQTERAICNNLQPSVTKSTLSRWFDDEDIRTSVTDIPIWRGKTMEEIRTSYNMIRGKIVDEINSVNPKLLYIFEIINKFMISCLV